MENVFFDLLNSDWHDWRGSGRREDRLDRPDWLREYLAAWGLTVRDSSGAPVEPGPEVVAELKRLRTLLRRIVDTVRGGDPIDPGSLTELNAVLARSPLHRRLVAGEPPAPDASYRVELVPGARDWDWVLASIAGAFADFLVGSEPSRFRVCANPDCGWVFYDHSRNRTRRWCEGRICGNLVKVRRFRAKQKQARLTGRPDAQPPGAPGGSA